MSFGLDIDYYSLPNIYVLLLLRARGLFCRAEFTPACYQKERDFSLARSERRCCFYKPYYIGLPMAIILVFTHIS